MSSECLCFTCTQMIQYNAQLKMCDAEHLVCNTDDCKICYLDKTSNCSNYSPSEDIFYQNNSDFIF